MIYYDDDKNRISREEAISILREEGKQDGVPIVFVSNERMGSIGIQRHPVEDVSHPFRFSFTGDLVSGHEWRPHRAKDAVADVENILEGEDVTFIIDEICREFQIEGIEIDVQTDVRNEVYGFSVEGRLSIPPSHRNGSDHRSLRGSGPTFLAAVKSFTGTVREIASGFYEREAPHFQIPPYK